MTYTSATAARNDLSTAPTRRIFRVENHDEALPIWRNSAGRERILVHVDAHHDMWWVPPGQGVTIANFISPALQEGILREIYWVVPDRSWGTASNRRQIFHHLRHILEKFPGRARVEVSRNHISTKLLGKRLHICSVGDLPTFNERVLLDLDVDYLIFPRVTCSRGDPHPSLPWRWPEDLVATLHSASLQSDVTTIAYSVRGGFTPIRWKYFGDELEARLRESDPVVLRGMRLMREGAEFAARGERSAAERAYLEAAEFLSNLAAPSWHLALLYLDMGRISDGQQMYQRALHLDPSYRTAFNSEALWHFWDQRWEAAQQVCRRTLALDSSDAYAHLVLGWLAEKSSDWRTAELEFHRALETQPNLLDAHRALGRVFRKLERPRESVGAHQRSLKLGLGGEESLESCPGIAAEPLKFNDAGHFRVFQALGELYISLGEWEPAERHLRMACAGGRDGVGLRLRLATVCFLQKHWTGAVLELAQTCKQLALQTSFGLRRLWDTLCRPFLHAYEVWRVR
jgi:tetratricopeptide (TPR) repeat protein